MRGGGGTVTSDSGVHEDVSVRTGWRGGERNKDWGHRKGSEDCCGFKGTFWATRRSLLRRFGTCDEREARMRDVWKQRLGF